MAWIIQSMVKTKELAEAEDLLTEVASWPEEEVERLPKFYRRKAREYRELAEQLDLVPDNTDQLGDIDGE